MTKEEANKKLTELQNQIKEIWDEIEELCIDHELTVSRPDDDSYREYFCTTNKDVYEMLGYGEHVDEDSKGWIDEQIEDRLPGWIGSSEFS